MAINRLEQNIHANNFTNIVVIKKALSSEDGTRKFGGNGELGNSMSTLLVGLENSKDFFNDYGRKNQFLSREDRQKNIIEVGTITLETFLEKYSINIDEIGLIKMDIEGGEYIVLPAIKDFLREHKPVFFISLHPVFLSDKQILEIIDLLFFDGENPTGKVMDRTEIIKNGHTSLLFGDDQPTTSRE